MFYSYPAWRYDITVIPVFQVVWTTTGTTGGTCQGIIKTNLPKGFRVIPPRYALVFSDNPWYHTQMASVGARHLSIREGRRFYKTHTLKVADQSRYNNSRDIIMTGRRAEPSETSGNHTRILRRSAQGFGGY